MYDLIGSATYSPGDGLWFIGLIGIVFLALAAIILFVAALISILASSRYTGGGKLLWLIAIFVFPFLGPLVWWLGGRKANIRRGY